MTEQSLLDSILAPGALTAVFQPIFEIRKDGVLALHGFEGLTRGPKGTNLEGGDVLFEYVRRKRQQDVVDRLCVGRVFADAGSMLSDSTISVNVHASTIGRDGTFVQYFTACAATHALPLDHIVIEVVEHIGLWDSRQFLRALDLLRAAGVRVALDDVGIGQSNFKRILDVKPDYLKIDRSFVHGIHHDDGRRAIVESIVLLGSRFGSLAVAEGVEDPEDLEVITSLGVPLAQGYGLCRARAASELRFLTGAVPLHAFQNRRAS